MPRDMTREEMISIIALSDKIDEDLAKLKRDSLAMSLDWDWKARKLKLALGGKP